MRTSKSILANYLCLSVLIMMCHTTLLGQSKKYYIIKNSIALNILEDIGVTRGELDYTNVYDTSKIFNINFVNPAFIFSHNPRSHHEFELSKLVVSRNEVTITQHHDALPSGRIQHFDENIFQLSLGYFYNHRFNRMHEAFEFYIGAGIYYSTNSLVRTPVSNQIYPWYTRKNHKQQFDVFFRPKVLWHVNDKFVADINLGVSVYQYYTHIQTNEGSIFTIQPEQVKLKKNDFFAQMFRVGIGFGYKFNGIRKGKN